MKNSPTAPRLVVIVGTIGSGKDAAGEYLAQKYGFQHVSASNVLRAEARRRGFSDPIERHVLSDIAHELREKYGPGPIFKQSLAAYEASGAFPFGMVITGFRRASEVKVAKEAGSTVIFIDAPLKQRFERISGRQRGDDLTWEEFKKRELNERHGRTIEGKEGPNILSLKPLADCVIENTGTLDELEKAIDKALRL